MTYAALRSCILALTLLIASEALAQNQPMPFLVVDFMKSTATDYTDVESTVWKPLHKATIDRGEKLSWNLYWVRYGDRSEFDYATVNVYPDLASTRGDYTTLADDFAKVHPGVDMDEAMAKTNNSREMVRSELWRLVLFEGEQRPYQHAEINYMKVPPGGGGDYIALERDWWAPFHRIAISKGCGNAWGVYEMEAPWGADTEYNYAAVNFSDGQPAEGCNFDAMMAEAHPGTEWEMIAEKTEAVRSLVKGVEWELIDNVAAMPPGN